jgi:penicillin-binding protein 1C
LKRFYLWIKRYRYGLSFAGLTIFLLWFFCLPSALFKTPTCTVIIDKDGNLLGATIAEDGQWRFPHNDVVPEKFKAAILEFEDGSFEHHLGVSLRGLARAFIQNISHGKKVSGGSTITMQLMRMSRGKQSRSIYQKCIEIFTATRAEWKYSKDELLALYASNVPMGGNVVGLDAAAWRYYGRSPDQLSWAESATLAVLPNAPSLMHPGKNRNALLLKRNRLLDRLYESKKIDSLTWQLAKTETLPDKPQDLPRLAPHLLNRAIRDGQSGNLIHTTIDAAVQKRINNIVSYHHQSLAKNKIHNAAVLIMDIETGAVISYVGNVPNLSAEHGKDVDIINAPRSTGSILKPFLYASMLEDGGLTPKMLVKDVPTVMSGYSPKNYNYKYDGIVPANEAIYRSLNVPLIRMLTQYGVEKFHHRLKQFNFSTLQFSPEHYGLSLILGGAEVTLWDLVSAYGILGRSLYAYPSQQYLRYSRAHYDANSVLENKLDSPINAANAWFTFEAMKEVERPDEEINWNLFSSSEKIGWKTGTSYGFRDAWAVGTNGRYVVGVWVGNADGEGRPGLIGREAAAPILFDVFSTLPESEWFAQPFDEMVQVSICQQSGHIATEVCSNSKKEWISKSNVNSTPCPYHEYIFLDETGTYRVNSACYSLDKSIKTSWFMLPAVVEYYYQNINPNFRSIPNYMPGCSNNLTEGAFDIIYPKSNSTIYIPINLAERKEKVILEATHLDKDMTLFWHLDDKYLGQTNRIHQLEILPKPGKHRLKIVDSNGEEKMIDFRVLLEKNNN